MSDLGSNQERPINYLAITAHSKVGVFVVFCVLGYRRVLF